MLECWMVLVCVLVCACLTQVTWDVWGLTQVGILALPFGGFGTLAKLLDFVETQFHGLKNGDDDRTYHEGPRGLKCKLPVHPGCSVSVLPTLPLLNKVELQLKLRSSDPQVVRLSCSQWLSSPPQTSDCWSRGREVSPQTWTRLALGPYFTATLASGRLCPMHTDSLYLELLFKNVHIIVT